MVDTAGIRDAQDQIEAIGVEKTMEKIQQSSILIYVFDVVRTKPKEVQQDIAKLSRPNQHLLIVANKMDLNPYAKVEDFFEAEGQPKDDERSMMKGSESNNTDNLSPSQPLTLSPSEKRSPSHALKMNIFSHSWVPISAINKMNISNKIYLKEKLYQAVVDESIDPSWQY